MVATASAAPSPGSSSWLQSWRISSGRTKIESPPASADATSAAHPGPQVEIAGRYAIGTHAALSRSGDPDPSVPILMAAVRPGRQDIRPTSSAAVVVAAELLGKDAALKRLKEIFPATPHAPKPAADMPPQMRRRQLRLAPSRGRSGGRGAGSRLHRWPAGCSVRHSARHAE